MSLHRKNLLAIVIPASLIRLGMLLFYQPRTLLDTYDDYFTIGRQLLSGNFENYLGRRPPVYPLIASALGYNISLLWILNSVLGVAIAVLLYFLFYNMFHNRTIALLAGLTYALNPSQILMESMILPETLIIFMFLCTLLAFFSVTSGEQRPAGKKLLLIGILAALSVLAHARFQQLPILIVAALFVWTVYIEKAGIKKALTTVSCVLLPVLLLEGSWATFQYFKIHSFCISPNSGYMITHVIDTIEYDESDKYKDIKLELVTQRQKLLDRGAETIWAPDMARVNIMRHGSMSYNELMSIYKQITIEEIKKHPAAYIKDVGRSFVAYWKPAFYSSRAASIGGELQEGSLFGKMMAVIYGISYLVLLLSFGAMGLQLLYKFIRGKMDIVSLQLAFIYTVITLSCLATVIIAFGENARYKMTFEPFVFACGISWLYLTFAAKDRGKAQ